MGDRFVLTDLGIVSALGSGVAETAERMFAGDVSGMVTVGGLVGGDSTVFGFAPDSVVSPKAIAAAGTRIGAVLDAAMAQLAPALDALRREMPDSRIGAVIGTSNSTMEEFTDNPDRIDMAYPAERLKSKWGVGGPAWSVSTACSSSAKVFASARRLLASDICDAVVVGGADAYTRTVVEGFHSLEALSPSLTRPLAADRRGINLGEGAAMFLLRRGNADGIELLGVGESSDAYHLTAPDPDGLGAEASMRAALADAGLSPRDIDYVNLHGTGTTYNDAMECAAVRRVFGDSVPCSSTKPMTGHCLGAAGAIEVALCWLAIRRGRGMPPHCVSPVDSALAPFPVPQIGDGSKVGVALTNSFAFGGSNATVVIGSRENMV